MDNQQYILSFNFEEVSSQIDSVAKSYTDLGSTLRGMTAKTSEDVEALKVKVASVSSTFNLMNSSLSMLFMSLRGNLGETNKILEDLAKNSKIISENFANIPKTFAVPGVDPSKDTAQERVQDILPQGVAAGGGGGGGEEDREKEESDRKESEDQKKETEKKHNMFLELIEKEARGAKSGVGSILSRAFKGGLGGGLLGGAITAMIMGYSEQNRKQTESGEMLNVMEATGEKLFTGPVQKANKWFSNFQEKAQFYYGIGRKEIQGVVKQMVDAGYKADDLMQLYDKRLGEVGRTTATLTLGIDKHLNLASGTSMQNVMKLTSEYGDSLQDASRNVEHLSRVAQQSGAGITKFIDSVMSGSAALTQYGIDLKDVVSLTSDLEKHYKDMGLDKRYAGQLATSAMQGITSGIAGFSNEMKAEIGTRMDPSKTGLSAIQSFEEGWQAIKTGEDKGRLIQTLEAMRNMQNERLAGADRATQIHWWKEQGLSGAGATAFVDEAAKGSFDRLNNNTEESNKVWTGLKNAFQTEGEAVSELQKDQRDIINGMAKVGKGLLGILGGLVGVIVLGIRSIPALIDYAINRMPGGDSAKADRIMEAITQAQDKQFGAISSSLTVLFGDEKNKGAFGELGDTALSKIFKVFKPLESAVSADLSGYKNLGDMTKYEAKSFIKSELEKSAVHQQIASIFDILDKIVGVLPGVSSGDNVYSDLSRHHTLEARDAGTRAVGGAARVQVLDLQKKISLMQKEISEQQKEISEQRRSFIIEGEKLLAATEAAKSGKASGADNN